MIRLYTVVGARPQFIKAAAISRAIRDHFSHQVSESILHTGQHYDDAMSDVFFREMEIPSPAYHLGIGSGRHGAMTGKMVQAIEDVLVNDRPDVLLVYGDTNSTLAGALAAAKLHIPVAHVEAGLRSYKKSMPEEINRRLCDHISTFLFPPTHTAFRQLEEEGLRSDNHKPVSADNPVIVNSGDVMLDNALYYAGKAAFTSTLLEQLQVKDQPYILCTVHRDFNTDNPSRLQSIFHGLMKLAESAETRLLIPLHPRTRQMLEKEEHRQLKHQIEHHPLVHLLSPVSYFETLLLLQHTRLVVTDSGGLQKESYFFRKPCVILRHETEWSEILETGNAFCADANEGQILQFGIQALSRMNSDFPTLYGDGQAARKILQTLVNHFSA